MADTKISDLPAATSIGVADVVPIVQSGTTKKAAANLFIGTTTPGSVSVIDLGIISASDAYTEGIKILLPVVDGRVITAVRYLTDNWVKDNQSQVFFGSGNDVSGDEGPGSGFAVFGQQFQDTIGLAGDSGLFMRCDGGPLGLVTGLILGALPRTWTTDTLYAMDDWVLKSNHIQRVITGGTSDATTEPTWHTDGGTVADGTVLWQDVFDISLSTATVHAIAEVIEIPGYVSLYPASLEWIEQPTDVVAGAPFDPEPQVRVLDQNGDPFTNANTLASSIYLYVLGAGTTTQGNPVITEADPMTGIATFTGVGMDAGTVPGTYQLVIQFRYDQLTFSLRLDSDPFDVTAP